jgi:hypothetical protein
MDVVVTLPVPILMLGMGERHPDYRYLRTARSGSEITM